LVCSAMALNSSPGLWSFTMISSRIAYDATLEQKNPSCAKHDPAIADGSFSESRLSSLGSSPSAGFGPDHARDGSILSRLFNSFV
jgi:hypothetical protein